MAEMAEYASENGKKTEKSSDQVRAEHAAACTAAIVAEMEKMEVRAETAAETETVTAEEKQK